MIWVEGPDAATFLNGLLSHDVAALGVGGARPALLLNERGHIRATVRVLRDADDAFTLLVAPERADEVVSTFARLHFTEDLDVLGPEVVAGVVTDGDVPEGADAMAPGDVPGTREVVGDAAVAALTADVSDPGAARAALEARRVAAAVPRVGVDTGERTLVQEAGLQDTHVSFSKGCYLGQETVSRAQHRGGVRRTLRVLRAGAPLAPGVTVTHGGADVGVVTSAATDADGTALALAMLRTSVPPGAAVDAGGVSARVHDAR
ncbi:MAG: hypothetical protein KDC33_02225 [Thermoleophilia bacterium]|nr:hypothetical protein [Thermoleophilia bacterium]